jgi:flagellar assembly protein FliH
MKWSETITFSPDLRDVRLLTQTPSLDWATHLREREDAAFQKGKREGERAAAEQLSKLRNELAERQKAVLDSLQRAVPQLIRESESALIQLALDSAQKIIAGLPVEISMVEAVVREALAQIEGTGEIVIQLHPEDLALLREHESPLLRQRELPLSNGLSDVGTARFVGSLEVTRGGCLVQTRFGIIDARRETKFERLQETANA